jgi:hypothetical protein
MGNKVIIIVPKLPHDSKKIKESVTLQNEEIIE